jgi:uncharacterized protein (DUF305 family)
MTRRPDPAGSATEDDSASVDAAVPRPEVVPRRRMPWLVMVAGIVAVLVAAGVAAVLLGVIRSSPADSSVDAGFARDMQTHHAQAVDMSFLIRDRTDDPQLRTVAYDIITSQQQQIGQMYGWLVQWGLPQTGQDKPMAWMNGHDHGGSTMTTTDGSMPGMATPAQLEQLRSADGRQAERLFLELMIVHHRAGAAMADAAATGADTDEVRSLAARMSAAQSAEIDLLTSMLAQRR